MATKTQIIESVRKTLEKPVFVIQMNYKSGHSVKMAFHNFELDNNSYSWEAVCSTIAEKLGTPESVLDIGAINIESIFVIESYTKASEIISEQELVDDSLRIYKLLENLK